MTVSTSEVDVYARVSRKGDKQQRSTGGQVQVCRAVLAERGLSVGQTHVDDGRSAWNPRVRRPGWDALMERLESGQAGGVIVFDLERFSRQPEAEGGRLIKAAERGLLVLDSDGEFDLTTATGKKNFRDAMAAAAYYSDRLSDRVTRGKRLKAMAGEPNGRVSKERGPFGFLPDGVTPHPEESLILREMTARFLSGETQDAILRDLNERGILTAYGKPWTRAGLRQVLTRPLNAGRVEYNGVIVATLPGGPVIDPDDFDKVLAMFAARRPGRPPSVAYLCSGSVTCGLCGKPMAGRPRINMKPYPDGEVRREYWCAPSAYGGCGKIAVDQRALDKAAREIAVAILSDCRHADQIEAMAAERRSEAEALDNEIRELEDLAGKLADRLGRGEITLVRYDRATAPLDKRLDELKQKRDSIPDNPASRLPVASEAIWNQRWEDADPSERRELLRTALNGRKLVIGPADRSERANVMKRVTLSGSGSLTVSVPAGIDPGR